MHVIRQFCFSYMSMVEEGKDMRCDVKSYAVVDFELDEAP